MSSFGRGFYNRSYIVEASDGRYLLEAVDGKAVNRPESDGELPTYRKAS